MKLTKTPVVETACPVKGKDSNLDLTVSDENLAKIAKIIAILEVDPDWYLNNILSIYLDDVLSSRLGELEADFLLYDSIEEARRITAACDAYDQKLHEWIFDREGDKFVASNNGHYTRPNLEMAA